MSTRASGPKPALARARSDFHARLLATGVWGISQSGNASNADKDNELSKALALNLVSNVGGGTPPSPSERLAAQTLGKRFEVEVASFLQATFVDLLGHLRPGTWTVQRLTGTGLPLAQYKQYEHLDALQKIASKTPDLPPILGNGYTVSPDVVILRQPEPDKVINQFELLVDDSVATRSSLRESFDQRPLIHASISCKWTMRSDRAQNARTEALNLIRNRKGHLPHVALVTGEPLPARLSSVALGTGDIDCVYHLALDELMSAASNIPSSLKGADQARTLLDQMVKGKRLKDIADLPLDLVN